MESSSRTPVASAAPALAPTESESELELVHCAGFVVGLPKGERVADVEVQLVSRSDGGVLASTRSDAVGAFELAVAPDVSGRVLVRDEKWITVASNFLNTATGHDAGTVVVARRGLLAGIVHEPSGKAVVAARCAVLVEDHFFSEIGVEPRAWGGPEEASSVAMTDQDGSFRLDGAPLGEGLLLLVMKDGYRSARVSLENAPSENLYVELTPLGGVNVWWGTVLSPTGEAVEGATVSGGQFLVKTDSVGAFRLVGGKTAMLPGVRTQGVHGLLRATLEGYLPAEIPIIPELESPVLMQLGPPALVARGRVVDEEGNPLEGVVVWSPDATLLGMERVEESGDNSGILITIEAVLSGGQRNFTTTDAAGRFELEGLLDQLYSLRAFDPGYLVMGEEVLAQPGGAEVELRLELAGLTTVAGRLLSETGEPMAGVRVVPMRSPFGVGEEWTQPPVSRGRKQAFTDEEGRFRFEALSMEGTTLSFFGRDVMEQNLVKLDQVLDPQNIEVKLGDPSPKSRIAFFVDLSGKPGFADEMVVLDAEGKPMEFLNRPAQTIIFSTRSYLRLEAGKSPVFSTTDAARTLVLYRGFKEVARLPLELVAGELNRVVP
jgi:hypothetical protein